MLCKTGPNTGNVPEYYRAAFERKGVSCRIVPVELRFNNSLIRKCNRISEHRLKNFVWNRGLLRTVKEVRPDFVFIYGSNWNVSPKTIKLLRKLGSKVILREGNNQFWGKHQVESLPLYDWVFTQEYYPIPFLRTAGLRNLDILPGACDPSCHFPRSLTSDEKKLFAGEIVFVGTNYGQREEFLCAASRTGATVTVAGRGWKNADNTGGFRIFNRQISGDERLKLYSCAKILPIILNPENQIEGITDRTFESVAVGRMVLHEAKSEIRDFFKPGKHMAVFKGRKDFVKKIEYYLANDREREDIAAEGRKHAVENHTYDHRVDQILATVLKR